MSHSGLLQRNTFVKELGLLHVLPFPPSANTKSSHWWHTKICWVHLILEGGGFGGRGGIEGGGRRGGWGLILCRGRWSTKLLQKVPCNLPTSAVRWAQT